MRIRFRFIIDRINQRQMRSVGSFDRILKLQPNLNVVISARLVVQRHGCIIYAGSYKVIIACAVRLDGKAYRTDVAVVHHNIACVLGVTPPARSKVEVVSAVGVRSVALLIRRGIRKIEVQAFLPGKSALLADVDPVDGISCRLSVGRKYIGYSDTE